MAAEFDRAYPTAGRSTPKTVGCLAGQRPPEARLCVPFDGIYDKPAYRAASTPSISRRRWQRFGSQRGAFNWYNETTTSNAANVARIAGPAHPWHITMPHL